MATTNRLPASQQHIHELVSAGATGRLSVGAGSAELNLFLLDGHVIAARAVDDTVVLIQRLAAAGRLSDARARQLHAMQHMSSSVLGSGVVDPILGLLFDEIADDVLDDLLQARFEENVARFVGHRGQPRFDDGVVPWAYNVRIGHDSPDLVDRAARLWEAAFGVDDAREVAPGPRAPEGDEERALAAAIEGGARTVGELVQALPLPTVAARALVARALESGLLVHPPNPADDDAELEEVDDVEALDTSVADLDAFSGLEDRHRGGAQGGTFVTGRESLDRVELVDLDEVGPAAPSYAAPTLTEEDARAKINVANEVLLVLAEAYERARGTTQGAATIQLLVDGRPRAYVPLFDGVQVRPAGDLPHAEVLANLRRRPDLEQRQLLNLGLLDLLDRALDKAADDLPEEDFEDVLGRVMGYRQRLVL